MCAKKHVIVTQGKVRQTSESDVVLKILEDASFYHLKNGKTRSAACLVT